MNDPKKVKSWEIFWEIKLENAFFAVKSSIFVRFENFKNWHLQNYQTKLTICVKLMWDLQQSHSGNLKKNDSKFFGGEIKFEDALFAVKCSIFV